MKISFKKMFVPVVMMGIALTLWSCTTKANTKIVFESNDGSHVAESTTKVETEPIPTKNGYVFEGWFLTSDFANERVAFPLDLGENDITLYAKWSLQKFTITYHLDGGTNHTSNPNQYTIEDSVKFENPTKNGKIFEGWYVDAEFKNAATSITKGTTGNMDLYAKWKDQPVVIESYKIAYHLDGGTNASDNPTTYTKGNKVVLKAASKKGYTFEGWYLEDSFKTKVTELLETTTGDQNLYAKFTMETYTITYHLDGGTNALNNPTSYTVEFTGALLAPTKTDMEFQGWYKEEDFKTHVTEIVLGSTGNLNLYAKWGKLANYTITYHLDGGTNHADNEGSYTPGTAFVFKDAAKVGYTFMGWYTDDTYTTKVTEIVSDAYGNKDVYAKFELDHYTINYHLDGGTNAVGNPANYTILDEVTFKKPAKDHMVFKGWYTDESLTTPITKVEAGSTGELNLYVKWERVDFTITYHLDGGVNDQKNPAGYTTGTEITLRPATKHGYVFAGWYADDAYTTKVTAIPEDATGNKDLYAKFTLEEYEVVYHLDGGINGENPASYTLEDAFTLKDATKAGYTFDGWYLDAEYQTAVEGVEAGSTGNKAFYAKFMNDYELMYGIWSKDNFYAFMELTQEGLLYNGTTYAYTMNDFTSSKINVGDGARADIVSFTYNPAEETMTFVREYFRNEDAVDRTSETSTLSKITLPDTKDIAGVYYTGDSRSVKDLVIDNYGHLTRFNGADTYQGTVAYENNLLTLVYKTNNIGDAITYTGTLEDGILTLTKDDVSIIYVKADSPKVYYSNNSIAVYQYKNFCVVEIDGNDTLATLEGEFVVDNLITLTYNDTVVKFRVKTLAGDSWGTLEAGGAHAGEYSVSGTTDKLVLDGFGPTNGTLGEALFNGNSVQYSMTKYLANILVVFADHTEKYYAIEDKVLTEITELDGLQGNYTNGTTTYRISGLGYAIRVNNHYFEVYTYDQANQTVTINGTVFTIYHNGNVLLRGATPYVKDGYNVETKDFTEYLDKTYQNEENSVKLRVSEVVEEDVESYKVTVVEAFTLNDVTFEATTYDAVYVLDRLVFNGVELVLSNELALVVANEHSYALTELVPEQTFAEKLVGLYVYNNSYYVNIFADAGSLKVYYGGSINPYSAPTAYDVTIEDEVNLKAQYKYSSYTFAFTFAEANDVKTITFDNETYVDYSYRGKTFTQYDDSTVELVSKDYESKAGSSLSASTVAVIKENGAAKSWSNINFVTPLTTEQKNVPGIYEVEVYAWVYGKRLVANVSYTVVENYVLSYSKKSIYAKEGLGKADIIALGMFTAKHNGANDVITEDMITLPEGFDSMVPGTYNISCTYHDQTQTAVLTINADPSGHYDYVSGQTNTSYGTYFSAGLDVELVDEKLKMTIGTTTLTNVVSGNEYAIGSKDITIKILENGQITLTYTDSRWNEYTTVYAKPKEVDLTKYEGVYVNGNCYVRLFAEDKKLKAYGGSSINPYSDPTALDCTILDESTGSLQFINSSSINAFTFSDSGTKILTFKSDSTVESNYRGKTFTFFDDSVVELVSKNSSVKAGTNPSASSLAEVKENGVSKSSWTNIKFVTNLTTEQKNELGAHEASVYAWVYGKKLVVNVGYTVVENYSLSKSNKTVSAQVGYGKAEIIASGMFTARHNGATDTITEDMITLPEGFDSNVAGTYTITCTYYTETLTATLTIRENPVGTYVYSGGNTTYANYGIYFKDGFTLEEMANGKYKLTSGSTVYENIDLDKSYETPNTYKTIYVNVTSDGIRIYEENWNYYCDYTKQA